MKRILICLCAVMVFGSLVSIALASEDLKVVNTKGGVLKTIAPESFLDMKVMLNDKILLEDGGRYTIVKKYDFDKYTVVIISSFAGGNIEKYGFDLIKINNNGAYKIYDTKIFTRELDSNIKVGNKIILVGEGYDNNIVTATLEEDRLTIKNKKIVMKKLSDSDYKHLYEIYGNACAYPESKQDKPFIPNVYGMDIASYRDRPGFNEDKFYKLCTETYVHNKRIGDKGVGLKYSEFKKRISKR
ncbi:MAG: hypothetical protein PHY48_09555 [Candidatus Cloacimonetes bacterium]|nr:hypothetical protein [Candidatus Cloacimonadota bacterium]